MIPTDPVVITYTYIKNSSSGDFSRISKSHQDFIENVIKSKYVLHNSSYENREILIEEMQELKDEKFMLKIISTVEREIPKLPWINIVLADDVKMRFNESNAQPTASFNLLDFKNNLMTLQQLREEIENVFGIYQTEYKVTLDGKVLGGVTKDLSGKTVVVRRSEKGKVPAELLNKSYPFSKFSNTVKNGKEVTVYLENPTNQK